MSQQEMTFKDFYSHLGFSAYPFGTWSAEQEEEKRSDLFIRPTFYGPIDEAFRNGFGMFLVGERGSGKTAAIYDFIRMSEDKRLVALIDDFSDVPVAYQANDLYRLVISRVSDVIFKKIFNREDILRKMTAPQRLLLSYIYKEFTTPTTKAELRRNLEFIQHGRLKRWGVKIYRFLRHPFNLGATALINIAGEAVSKALGNISLDVHESKVKEIFPDIPLKCDETFNDQRASLRLLVELAKLASTIGLGKLMLVIDKLDEDGRLEGDAEKIKSFVKGVVGETSLYLSGDVQLVASIWSIPFKMLLKENIRTQKMIVHELSWGHKDLVMALNRRLGVYSNGKISDLAHDLLAQDVDGALISSFLDLANGNPRDLWHLMDQVLQSQFAIDPAANRVCRAAIEQGMRLFVSKFNYFEYYPRKAGARANSMDVYAYIRHLLRLASVEFTRNQLSERSGVSGAAVNNYVSTMENMGMVISGGQVGGNVVYVIRDPKIRFALENGIDISLTT